MAKKPQKNVHEVASADSKDLPEGWAATCIEDVVAELQPGFACGTNNRGGDGVAHLRPMNVNTEGEIDLSDVKYIPAGKADSDRKWLRRDDVLFNNTNSTELVGKTAIYEDNEPRAFSNHMTRVRVYEEALDPKYCAIYLHHCWRDGYFQGICNQHVSQSSVSRTRLLATPIDLPPLAEQKRIVTKVEALLERVNKARERLDRVPDILKKFRQSVLAAACSGRLTADWREENLDETAVELIEQVTTLRKERYSSACTEAKANGQRKPRAYDNELPELRDDLPLFELPDEWQWVDLRFLMDEQRPFCYGVVQPGAEAEGGNYLVRAGDLDEGTVDISDLRTISAEVDAAYERSRLDGGEVLVTVVGANAGVAAIAPDSCRGFNIARAVAKLPIRDFNAAYLLTWLSSSTAIGWMKRDAREVARPTLNLEQLKTLPVPLPPLPEQEEVVRRAGRLLEEVRVAATRVSDSNAFAERISQSVLAKVFTGELVETEADLARREGREYEPAWVLLERIKDKREDSTAKTSKSRRKKVAKRKSGSVPRSLTEVIREAKDGLSPEELAQNAGFDEQSVEVFYRELRDAVEAGTIVEERLDDSQIRLTAGTS